MDYANLCAAASAQSHPGAAMQCLKDSRDLLQEEACHEAVLGVIRVRFRVRVRVRVRVRERVRVRVRASS